MSTDWSERAAAVADAIAAFDAANLAWGQFYQHAWRLRPEVERALAQPLREAMGEAALSVPNPPSPEALHDFVQALDMARAQLQQFVDAVDPALVPGDVRDLGSLLDEAAGYLRPYVEG